MGGRVILALIYNNMRWIYWSGALPNHPFNTESQRFIYIFTIVPIVMSVDLSEKINSIMKRELQSLATSLLDKQCQQLDIDSRDIKPEDLPALAHRLSEMMRTLGGYDKAKRDYKNILKLEDLDNIAEEVVSDDARQDMLEDLAKATLTPLGFFFLETPPEERLPVPYFRTPGGEALRRPSPDLLETTHTMQRRQAWMREFLIEQGQDPLPFVRSALPDDPLVSVAERIRRALGFDEGWAAERRTWTDALRVLREGMEAAGILVVGGLDEKPPAEFGRLEIGSNVHARPRADTRFLRQQRSIRLARDAASGRPDGTGVQSGRRGVPCAGGQPAPDLAFCQKRSGAFPNNRSPIQGQYARRGTQGVGPGPDSESEVPGLLQGISE